MSEAVQQFVELVQEAAAKIAKTKQEVHYMYCQDCGGKTAHNLKVQGRWEYYTCRVCGCRKSYKVR